MLEPFIKWYTSRHKRREGRNPAPSTLKGKRSRLNTAMRNTSTNNVVALAEVLADRRKVEKLLTRLYDSLSPGSVQLIVWTLRDLGEWAELEGIIGECKLLKVDAPAGNPQKAITTYTAEEADTLIAAARGVSTRFWAYLLTVSETGRRPGEVLGLRWEWLRLVDDPPHFELPHTKAGVQQFVPLPPRLVREVFTEGNVKAFHLKDGRFEGDPSQGPFPWHYQSVYMMTRRLSRVTGVPHKGLHAFRHTKATNMLAAGVPIQAVSALLGHRSVNTTDRAYNHTTALSYAQYL